MNNFLHPSLPTKNYCVLFLHGSEQKKTIRYLRSNSDHERRSFQINKFISDRFKDYKITEVREIASITSIENKLVNDASFGESELFSISIEERIRKMKRKIDGAIEEMKIVNPNIKLGSMILNNKLILYRVVFKL